MEPVRITALVKLPPTMHRIIIVKGKSLPELQTKKVTRQRSQLTVKFLRQQRRRESKCSFKLYKALIITPMKTKKIIRIVKGLLVLSIPTVIAVILSLAMN